MFTLVSDVVDAAATAKTTTFADLFFSGDFTPWELVAISITAAFVGMFTHWVKVFYKENTHISVFEWFFVHNVRGTVFAVLGLLGALAVAFAPLDYTTITAYQAVSQAWAIGYAADSMFNSQQTKEAAASVAHNENAVSDGTTGPNTDA